MKVTAFDAEQTPSDQGKNRIAQISVEKWHGTSGDASCEAIAHDEIRAVPQQVQKLSQIAKIITVVSVAHDHITASRGADAGP